MKTKAERLDEILDDLFYQDYDRETSKRKILVLFKECVQESDLKNNDFSKGWDWCRWVTLKNIEEMEK